MHKIHAEKVDIEFDDDIWRIYEDDTGLLFSPLLEFMRGNTVIKYQPKFAEAAGLIGTQLSIDFVRGVLVGYQEESKRWLLGLHLSKTEQDKPVFKALVRWPAADSTTYVNDVRRVAYALSRQLGCALKVFGEKKLAAPSTTTTSADPKRSGFTGPLEPHNRQRLEKKEIEDRADKIKLPIQGEGFTLSSGKRGPVLKLGKAAASGKNEAPVFNLVEVDGENKKVKLIPPTGLLGAFLRTPGQEAPFHEIFNIEYRHIRAQVLEEGKQEKGKIEEEEMSITHSWELFLTRKDQSLLLLHLAYKQSSYLLKNRVTSVAGGKLATNSIEGLNYFQQHLKEQETMEKMSTSVEESAYVMAAAIGCPLVLTEVEI